MGWGLDWYFALWGEYESRGYAADVLLIERRGGWTLSEWERETLRAITSAGDKLSERQRKAVRRIVESLEVEAWDSLPGLTEPSEATAIRALREAMEIEKPAKKTKRKKGKPEEKAPEKKKISLPAEADIACPVCSTGARLKGWASRANSVSFFCQNHRCVKKS